jgi:ATP-dependent Lhr-like helicase
MADGRLRALVCTTRSTSASTGANVDLVIQMGAPKGSRACCSESAAPNHRMDEASEGTIVPGNRFEYLEAGPPSTRWTAGELDPEIFRPGNARHPCPAHPRLRLRRPLPPGRAAGRESAPQRLMQA